MPGVFVHSRRATLAVVGIAILGSGLFLIGRLAWWNWDASLLADVGRQYTTGAPLPAGLNVQRNVGFDGQFFYRLALNPATTKRAEFGLRFDQPSRRQERILYPSLAWLASGGGRARAVPWALIAVNLVSFGVLAWEGVAIARQTGRSPPAGLFFVATPGLVIALGFDTTEILAIALFLAIILLLRRSRYAFATVASTAALFARETTLIIAIGLLAAIIWSKRRGQDYEINGRSVPVWCAAVPIATYAIWQAVLWIRWGKPAFTSTDGSDLGAPFVGLVRAIKLWHSRGQTVDNVFFLVATLAVVILGLTALRRTRALLHERAAFVAAVALAVLYQWTILVHYATFLRALSETFVLAVLVLLDDQRRNVLPFGLIWIEVWGYLAYQARVIG